MRLFTNEDILTKEIESWKGFVDNLPAEDRKTFMKVLNDCYKYSKAINVKGEPFPTESLIMGLLFSQHKLIGRTNFSSKNKCFESLGSIIERNFTQL
jgi:hypothetical protein